MWEEIEHGIHYASITILFMFAAEICLLVVGLGTKFFQHPLLVLDAVIIGAALALDLSVKVDEGGGLLILLRFWRLLRIVHGAFTVEHHETEHLEEEHGQLVSKVEHARAALLRALDADRGQGAGSPHVLQALQLLEDQDTISQQKGSPAAPRRDGGDVEMDLEAGPDGIQVVSS